MFNRLSLPFQTFLAMCLGLVVGSFFGPELAFLGNFSQFLVSLIKLVALPLVFFAIVDGFLKSEFQGKGFLWMILISGFNALCAVSIALIISNVFHPGKWLPSNLLGSSPHQKTLKGFYEFSNLFGEYRLTNLLTGTTLTIILALGIGVGLFFLKRLFSDTKPRWVFTISKSTSRALGLLFWCVDKLVLLLPLAVFCSVVKSVGLHGFTFGKGLLAYFLSCSLGMALHIGLVYQIWIRWAGKVSLSFFWKIALEPALYAFGINSSLATLPITLKALDKLEVTGASARLSCCIGTNFNNDGILLYELVAVLFVTQAYGMELPLASQLFIAFVSIISCIGVSGIPEAGIIALTIVLSSVGLPSEAIPLLLTVDWVLARMRSFTNVLGDMTVGIAIDRITSQGRFSQRATILK